MVAGDDLQAGIAAATAGDHSTARRLLAKAVTANPNSEQAWLWLGLVLQEQDRRAYCFRRVLALNPSNAEARRQLPGPAPATPGPVPKSNVEEQVTPALRRSAISPAPKPKVGAAPPVPSSPIQTTAPSAPRPLDPHLAPAAQNGPGGPEEVWGTIIGLLIGLLLGGGVLYYAIQTGRFNFQIPVTTIETGAKPVDTAMPLPTTTPIPPTPTLTVSPTSAPTATSRPSETAPRPTPTLNPEQFAALWASETSQAQALMKSGKYVEAIVIWDQIIATKPSYGVPYLERARCYRSLLKDQRILAEYRDYLMRALVDVDRAIALGPATGDYYLMRSDIYADLASLEEMHVDYDLLQEIARENLKVALAMGTSNPTVTSDASYDLVLGRCDTFLAEVRELMAARGKTDAPDAAFNSMLGRGYLCKGDLEQALKYMDAAISQEPSSYRGWTRAIILFNMGLLDEALPQVTEWIDASPSYNGGRYYFRALIYYDLKEPDLAKQDLVRGSGNTWGHYGLYSYVQGRLMLDAGDVKAGTEQLQVAEATLSWEYGPLIDRIRREINELNAAPLNPTPSISITVTPIPKDISKSIGTPTPSR